MLEHDGADARDLGKIDVVRPRAGDVLTIMTPGGGGYGDPFTRDPALVAQDVRFGLVSREAARRDYGVVLDDDHRVDAAATQSLRRARDTLATPIVYDHLRLQWERLFDDEVMTRFARALLHAPAAIRVDARRRVFEAAAPGIADTGLAVMAVMGFDLAAARTALSDAVGALEQKWPGPGNITPGGVRS
jgi:N-methylhydantoinase B